MSEITSLVDPDRLGRWMDAVDLPGSGEPVELAETTDYT
jgi:hypothetical protein